MEHPVWKLSSLRRIAEIFDDDFHRALIFADVWLWRLIVTRYLSQRLWRIYSINEYLFIVIKWIYCFSISCIEIETRSRFFFFWLATLLVEIRIRFVTSGKSLRKEVISMFPSLMSTSCPFYFDVQLSSFKKHWILQTLEDQTLYSFEVSSSLQFCPHSLFDISEQVLYHVFSDSGPKKDQWSR